MLSLAIAVGLTLVFASFCSMSEAALYAVPAARVETLRQQGSSLGARLALLRERIERPITAILFFNTVATTMGAAIAGALFSEVFDTHQIMWFSIGLTLAMLIFAEILPKSLGFGYSGALAPLLAWPIQALVWMIYPFVLASERMARLVVPRRQQAGPSEEEIITLALLGARGGTIRAEEAKWVRHVLRLNDITVGDIMTPRPVVATLVGSRQVSELAQDLRTLNYSRLPVTTEEGPDHITGIALRRRIVNAFFAGKSDQTVGDLQQPAQFVPATMRCHELLNLFIRQKIQMAVVVDEYGGTMGVVTLEDVIETMLGEEFVSEFDLHPDLRQYARERAAARLKERE